MWTVFTCIRDEHDIRFVLAAAVLCVVAAVTALRFLKRAEQASRWGRLRQAGLAGLVAGSGVWATHFVAMLAYRHDLPIRFEPWTTALSGIIAIVGMTASFGFAAIGAQVWRKVVAGAGLGLSIVSMHFAGVAAVRAAFAMEWNLLFVAASIILAVAGGIAALVTLSRLAGWKAWAIPPALMVCGIVGLHFTAMAAVTVVPDLTLQAVTDIGRSGVAISVSLVSLLIAGMTVLLTILERRTHRRSLHSLETAFQGVPSGLAMYDAEDRLQLWNSAYERLVAPYGMKPRIGTSRRALLRQAAGSGAVRRTQEEGEASWAERVNTELRSSIREWETPQGLWLRSDVCSLANGGSITILSDITDQRTAAQAMIEARDRAEAASRAKSEFLANMSHEIRTPLNGVLGMVQVMEGDRLSAAQRERLKVVRDSGASLLAILNDVLDLSKIQAGRLELEEAEIDVVELARQTVAAFETNAAARDLSLTLTLDEAATGVWRGDGLRVRQILTNLIGNALKFTNQGGVSLGVAVTNTGMRFAVRDTGIGISAEHLPRLFDKFSQADASTTRQYGGTGLGLSICRDLAELMGGTIAVQSVAGQGSSFTVDLPLVQTSRTAPAPERQEAATQLERPLRILAAEDNPTNQLVLRSLLAPLSCELVMTANGREAVEAFAGSNFDLMLMDIQMPEMNGVEAMVAIRAAEAATGAVATPIIALTANVMNHQLAEYRAAGADHWVAKPIELEKLYAAIEQVLTQAEARAAA